MAHELFDLSGRMALVTGSSRGIGFALARGLGQAGAAVVVNARHDGEVEAAVGRLRDENLVAYGCVFDATAMEQVETAVGDIENGIGAIDILVNNAGVTHRGPLHEFPLDEWRRVIDTNLTGVFAVGTAVAHRMIERRRGKIINVCSIQSELARPGIGAYVASKGGVKMLTKSMCADWAQYGIQINGIGPGYFVTPLNQALKDDASFDQWVCSRTPAGRWGHVEELVGPAVFLASAASDFVNGQIVYVDGGILAVL